MHSKYQYTWILRYSYHHCMAKNGKTKKKLIESLGYFSLKAQNTWNKIQARYRICFNDVALPVNQRSAKSSNTSSREIHIKKNLQVGALDNETMIKDWIYDIILYNHLHAGYISIYNISHTRKGILSLAMNCYMNMVSKIWQLHPLCKSQ